MEAITLVLGKATLTEFSTKFVNEGHNNMKYLLKKSKESLTVILREYVGMGKEHIIYIVTNAVSIGECIMKITKKFYIKIDMFTI